MTALRHRMMTLPIRPTERAALAPSGPTPEDSVDDAAAAAAAADEAAADGREAGGIDGAGAEAEAAADAEAAEAATGDKRDALRLAVTMPAAANCALNGADADVE